LSSWLLWPKNKQDLISAIRTGNIFMSEPSLQGLPKLRFPAGAPKPLSEVSAIRTVAAYAIQDQLEFGKFAGHLIGQATKTIAKASGNKNFMDGQKWLASKLDVEPLARSSWDFFSRGQSYQQALNPTGYNRTLSHWALAAQIVLPILVTAGGLTVAGLARKALSKEVRRLGTMGAEDLAANVGKVSKFKSIAARVREPADAIIAKARNEYHALKNIFQEAGAANAMGGPFSGMRLATVDSPLERVAPSLRLADNGAKEAEDFLFFSKAGREARKKRKEAERKLRTPSAPAVISSSSTPLVTLSTPSVKREPFTFDPEVNYFPQEPVQAITPRKSGTTYYLFPPSNPEAFSVLHKYSGIPLSTEEYHAKILQLLHHAAETGISPSEIAALELGRNKKQFMLIGQGHDVLGIKGQAALIEDAVRQGAKSLSIEHPRRPGKSLSQDIALWTEG
jgi:hypothetical protein